ncbi:MAG TPA: Stp1/IreP family PP2C-type Ser/Thr phosphatase [Acidimicrobiales bacterium]|nr:Stp1/IreP family PP2C-type Ser/Thr phosphatase [Acidimicrobiales bacterium]
MTALRTGAVTDVGRVRTNNEDQLLVMDALFAVADGMGGHAAGEVASQVAVDTLRDTFTENPTAQGLLDAVRAANVNVITRSEADAATRGMGTTVCAAALVPSDTEGDDGEVLVILNVGDSRAYLLRDGELSQITEDHSVADELMRAGQLSEEEAAIDRRRHVLTRVLGMDKTVVPDRFDVDPFRGDRVLLASDGLTNEVPDAEIASILRRIADPGEAARELVRVAKNNGGADNVTVIVIDVSDDDGKAQDASEALAKDPPRPRGLITAAERDSKLRDLADTEPSATAADRPGNFDEPRRRLRPLRLTAFGLAVIAVIALAFGAITYFGRPWYVSAERGNIALFRGHGDSGLIKEQLVERTDIPLDSLDGAARERVRQGIEFDSRAAAEAYIARQRTTATTTSTPTSTSTTVPTSSTLFVPTTTTT